MQLHKVQHPLSEWGKTRITTVGVDSINQCSFHQPVQLPSTSAASINQCSFHQPVQLPSTSAASINQCSFHQPVQLPSPHISTFLRFSRFQIFSRSLWPLTFEPWDLVRSSLSPSECFPQGVLQILRSGQTTWNHNVSGWRRAGDTT